MSRNVSTNYDSRLIKFLKIFRKYIKDIFMEEMFFFQLPKFDSLPMQRHFNKMLLLFFLTDTGTAADINSKELRLFSKRAAEEQRRKETLKFMKGVMDEITHLGNYSKPVDPTAVTFVIAKDDAYFPQSSLEHMKNIWPGCEVREIFELSLIFDLL